MRTIEQLATELLIRGVPFFYSKGSLIVKETGNDITIAFTASYHNATKKLVIMDDDYKEIEFIEVFK